MVDVCVYVKATEVYGVGGVGREEEGRAGTIKTHTHTHTHAKQKHRKKKVVVKRCVRRKELKEKKGFEKEKRGKKKKADADFCWLSSRVFSA